MTELCTIIKTYGLPGFLLLVIYFCIKNPDKISIWSSIIQSYFGKRYERKSIFNEIEGKINLFVRKVNNDVGGDIFPYGIKMQWVEVSRKDFDREAFVKKSQVIIKMKPHQNQDRNLAFATLDYVSKGLIPKGRLCVSKDIMRSIDFKMVHKILISSNSSSAFEYFADHILSPEIRNETKLKEYFEKMHNIDDVGFFASVLLFELMMLGKKILPGIESIRKRAIAEVKDFISFLNDLAIRKPGEEPGLNFIRKEIKVSLLLIARPEHLGHKAIYLRRFKKNLEEGCERVYVGSMGHTNNSFAKEVCSVIEKEYETVKILENTIDVMRLTGNVTKGYICVFQPKIVNTQ